jgi:hypothetical protein
MKKGKIIPSLVKGSAVYLIPFSAYLELNPGLTNIWYRIGSDGMRHVNLDSYVHFLTRPLYMPELWHPRNWDLNFFVGAGLTSFLVYRLT